MAFNTENVTPYERSSQIFERRRSLFPQNYVDSDDESDLGCISALSNSSFDEDEDVPNKTSSNFEDYDIIGIVRKDISLSPRSISDKECPAFAIEESYTNIPHSPLASTSKEASLQTSPSYNLKTPHDTVTMNSKLPRLTHKSVTDSTASKRKLSPYNSPELSSKSLKIDIRNSKVRTTLFPEINLFLPTKKFYSNTDPIIDQSKELKKQSIDCLMEQKDETKKLSIHGSSVYIRRRNTSKRKNVGKINAGVGHKIRKPKQKRNSLLPHSKYTMTEKESNALKYYLENLKELKSSNDKSKLIENKENSSPDVSVLLTSMECSTTQFVDNFTSASQSFTKMPHNSPMMSQISSMTSQNSSNSNHSLNTTSLSYVNQSITHTTSSTSQNYATQLGKNPADTNQVFTSNFGAGQPVTNCLSTNVANINTTDVTISSELSNKRPLSPTAEEPDQSKKFFKFSRAHKGVVTLNKSMKLSVNHGRISLMGRSTLKKSEQQKRLDFEPEDFTVEEPVMSQVVMDNILTTLADQDMDLSTFTESQNRTSFVVPTSNDNASSFAPGSNSVSTSNPANLILSPISQMCDVTSGLALDSPKRVKNLSSLMENVTRSPKKRLLVPPKENSVGKKKMLTLAERKFKKLHKDQMLLDAGQKNFGVTQCTECNFVYHMGDPSDEACHINYHEAVPVLKFAVSMKSFFLFYI